MFTTIFLKRERGKTTFVGATVQRYIVHTVYPFGIVFTLVEQ